MKIVPFVFALLLAGYQNFPRDPRDTLDKVKGGVLKVAYSENSPWVRKSSHVGGIEAMLMKRKSLKRLNNRPLNPLLLFGICDKLVKSAGSEQNETATSNQNFNPKLKCHER